MQPENENLENIETKFIQRELQDDSETHYKFAGYACVFDEVDSYNTVMKRGCFKASVEAQETRQYPIPLLWCHDSSIQIGSIERIYEDDYGLFMEARLTKGIQRAEEAYTLMKSGDLSGLSIGCGVISKAKENGRIAFTALKLHEVSVVPLPSNDLSRVIIVRSMIENNEVPSMSHVERALREVFSLSRSQAKAFLNHGYKAIQGIQREAEPEAATDIQEIQPEALEQPTSDSVEQPIPAQETEQEIDLSASDAVTESAETAETATININEITQRAIDEINSIFRSMR